jgi:hypothetical protein
MLDEQVQIEIGMFCHTLMADDKFNQLVSLCEGQLSLEMLESNSAEEREKTYNTYQGLKTFLARMQQFVINKDQIAARKELEEEEKENE